jgi:hypothetical protein
MPTMKDVGGYGAGELHAPLDVPGAEFEGKGQSGPAAGGPADRPLTAPRSRKFASQGPVE